MTQFSPYRPFRTTGREIIRLAVMTYIRSPLSLHNGENLVHDQGIYTCHETLRF